MPSNLRPALPFMVKRHAAQGRPFLMGRMSAQRPRNAGSMFRGGDAQAVRVGKRMIAAPMRQTADPITSQRSGLTPSTPHSQSSEAHT